jgi:hypothetical protein
MTKQLVADLAAEISQQREKLHEASEFSLARMARGALQTWDDTQVFDALGWDRDRVAREVHRVKMALATLAEAGTPAELAAAQKRAQEIAESNAAARPAIQKQADELQARLASMDEKERAAAAEFERRNSARQRSRDWAPAHAKAAAEKYRQYMSVAIGQELSDKQARVRAIENVLALSFGAREQILLHCASLPPNHPAYPQQTGKMMKPRTVDPIAWEGYRLELIAEGERLMNELQPLLATRREFDAEAARCLDYYWQQAEQQEASAAGDGEARGAAA